MSYNFGEVGNNNQMSSQKSEQNSVDLKCSVQNKPCLLCDYWSKWSDLTFRPIFAKYVERAMRFEPTTLTLASKFS